MKTNVIVAGCLVLGLCGCSQESRDEVVNRVGQAAKALNGEVRLDDKEHETPNIVAEQQRKERVQQNTKWTPENQARYPVEYCQSQLEEMDKYVRRLETSAYKNTLAKSRTTRSLADVEVQISTVKAFLSAAKKSYKEAEAKAEWPTIINGYSYSRESAQEKIVAAVERLESLNETAAKNRKFLVRIEKKAVTIAEEQKKAVQLKERIQTTLNDLQLKKTIQGEDGITDSLNVISDSMGALGTLANEDSELTLDEAMMSDKSTTIKKKFDAIMAE